MRTIQYHFKDSYEIAILIKESSFNKQNIYLNYVKPLNDLGIAEESIIAFSLKYSANNKLVSVAIIKEELINLLPTINELNIKYLLVADSTYFKKLIGQNTNESQLGYSLNCKFKGYEHLKAIQSINYHQLIFNPSLDKNLSLSIHTLVSTIKGNYIPIGTGIIHTANYPKDIRSIQIALDSLHQYNDLTCDIETFSLSFNKAGIGTIAFAWDRHNGIAFPCDFKDSEYVPNLQIRKLIKTFFENYKGSLTFHNATYDVKILIATLWMENLLDTKGLLTGLEILTKNFHDTKIIGYLATNSTTDTPLDLKTLAYEFAGNWAIEEIKDISKISLDILLKYNLVDALSTYYVKDKYYPIMVRDNQEELYKGLMLDSLRLIIQMELTGMPVSKSKVEEIKPKLLTLQNDALTQLTSSHIIQTFVNNLQLSAQYKDFETRKLSAVNPDKIQIKSIDRFKDINFNCNSPAQLQKLLYEVLQLPIIDYTKTKQPGTKTKVLKQLLNLTTNKEHLDILNAIILYKGVDKIISTFIPALEQGIVKDNSDIIWLHGSFNLGGTVSGRLSSSNPNMQNIPAKSTYGDLIKECFVSTSDWLFAGADFNSLEDYISALTTKDPNKLAVYIDGFDGHCLRAASYFSDSLSAIDITDPKSVNSIKDTFPDLRQDSKAPTFALTYQGTWITLVKNLGFTEEKAKIIEAKYHELYRVSDEYIQKAIEKACKDGYMDVAFGLRVRTPLLKQVVYGVKGMPYEAAAEARTVGNAKGQSYGLLNNRAATEFMKKVWVSPYRYDILPISLIHDAIYLLIRNDVAVVHWVNRELIKSMQWQELPELQHPIVKLNAALDIFWPNWSCPLTIPNNATQEEIIKACNLHKLTHLIK